MKTPPPEKRKCEICSNTMTLNLFRLNSSQCRYCQDGLSIPNRLIDDPLITDQQEQDSTDKNKLNSLDNQMDMPLETLEIDS